MKNGVGKVIFFLALLQPLVALTWETEVRPNVSIYDVIYWPLFAIMAGLFFMVLMTRRQSGLNTNGPLILLFMAACVSLYVNRDKLTAIDFTFIASFVLLFLEAPYVFAGDESFNFFLKILLVVLLVPAFIGYLQLAGIVSYDYLPDWIGDTKVDRLTGGYSHPNTYGYYMTFGIAAALYLFDIKRIKWHQLLGWLLIVLPTIYFTYHRATWLAAISIFMLYFLNQMKGKRKLVMLIPIVLIIISSSGIIKGVDLGYDQGALRGRYYIFPAYFNAYIAAQPPQLLFGFGNPLLFGSGLFGAHNDYLNTLYIYGLLGLLTFLAFLSGILLKILRHFRVHEGEAKKLAFFGIAVLTDYFFYSLTAEPMREYYFYFFFALSISYITWVLRKPSNVMSSDYDHE